MHAQTEITWGRLSLSPQTLNVPRYADTSEYGPAELGFVVDSGALFIYERREALLAPRVVGANTTPYSVRLFRVYGPGHWGEIDAR